MDQDVSVASEVLIPAHSCCTLAYSCSHPWFLTENVTNTDEDQVENAYKY